MVRLALAGCGDSASRIVSAMPRVRDAGFTATVDTDVERARTTGQALGASLSCATLEELLARHAETVDAVVIETENASHTPLARQAARAGKHVCVRAPLGLSAAQADEVIAACRASGVRLMVNPPLRFLPETRAVKASLEAGELGRPGALRLHRWTPRGTERWGASALDPARTGGTVVGALSEDLDLANWFFGGPPNEVFAVGRKQASAQLAVYDFVQVHLGFADGGMALIDYALTLPRGDGYFSCAVIGSDGAAYADDHTNVQLVYRGGHPAALNPAPRDAHVVAALQAFVNAIEQNREPPVTGADGRLALEVAAAVDASLGSGRAARRVGDGYELV